MAKLGPARMALVTIVRAIKKRDYMLLGSDAVTEVDRIKPVAPDIAQYQTDLLELRKQQKGIFSRQFRSNVASDDERNFVTLPMLSGTQGSRRQDGRAID